MTGTIINTPEGIKKVRELALLSALYLETKGMTKRSPSAYSMIKKEFKLKGSKVKVLAQYKRLLGV